MKKRAFGILLIASIAILVFIFLGCEKPKTYEVTFSAGAGIGIAPVGGEYEKGATFTLPDDSGFTKAGYHFKAWNDGTADYGVGATYTMPDKAVTFTALWEVDVTIRTVTFDPNNGEESWTEQVADGRSVAKPATNPTIEGGKIFHYWKNESGKEYSFNTAVTADIELTAVYEYKIMFSAGEGTGEVDPIWLTSWTSFGIKLPDGERLTHSEGKLFDGWKDEEGNTYNAGDFFVGTGNHALTAVWREPIITVSFESSDSGIEGTAPESMQGKHLGDEITFPENPFSKYGYVFKGWYVKGQSDTTLYQPGDTYTIPKGLLSESLVFMVKWEPGDFTITYKAGDHAFGDDIVENRKGGEVFLQSNPFTPENTYIFVGWKKEGESDSSIHDPVYSYTLGEDTVFIAQWAHMYHGLSRSSSDVLGEIVLDFDTNDGHLLISSALGIDSEDVALTLTLDGTAISITLEGCEAVNGTIENNELNIALTYGGKRYIFGQLAKYNIYFYTDDKATQVDSMFGIEVGDSINEPEEPKKIGYVFKGWYTDKETYQNKFVFDKMPDNHVVLYALWERLFSDEELAAYENSLDENSENGHLYIHYMRFDNDPTAYEKMSLWIWPKAYTGKTFNWKKDQEGNVLVDDIGGAVCDVDLTQFYTGAGTDESETLQFFNDGAYGEDYKPEYIKDVSKYLDSQIGFLIVYDDSKNSGTHWISDGGNQYFVIFSSVRENGSIHIFATQDNVGDFVFTITGNGESSNP